MPTTLNPTCPLCGLRYTDRSLLELHIREDHRPRERPRNQIPAAPVTPRPPRRGQAAPARAGPRRSCTG